MRDSDEEEKTVSIFLRITAIGRGLVLGRPASLEKVAEFIRSSVTSKLICNPKFLYIRVNEEAEAFLRLWEGGGEGYYSGGTAVFPHQIVINPILVGRTTGGTPSSFGEISRLIFAHQINHPRNIVSSGDSRRRR